MIDLAVKLLLAHVLGDFVLQPSRWIKHKQQEKHRSPYLYFHVLVHLTLLIVMVGITGRYWLGIGVIVISHLIIDLVSVNLIHRVSSRWLFMGDQFAHVLILDAVVYYYHPFSVSPVVSTQNLLLVVALLLVTVVSAKFMKKFIARWDLTPLDKDSSLKDAGTYIGILERLFAFVFIVAGQWQALGFLLAAKSVFRFGDLSKSRDRKLTEYILIGTLMSFALAVIIALAYLKVLLWLE